MPSPPSVATFKERLIGWKDEVADSTLRGTFLRGIANSACVEFETQMREALQRFAALAGLTYETHLRALTRARRGGSIDELTLGQVVTACKKYNVQLGAVAGVAVSGELFSPADLSELSQVVSLRNRVSHRRIEPSALVEAAQLLLETLLRLVDHVFLQKSLTHT